MTNDEQRTLIIDLTRHRSELKVHTGFVARLGGVALGASLFHDYYERNPIIIAIGPLTGLLPYCGSCVAHYRSLSGDYSENFSGWWLGAAIQYANLDALIIYGKSSVPVIVEINETGAIFHPARDVWGKSPLETTKFIRENLGLPGKSSIAAIGLGGEEKLPMANVTVDCWYSFSGGGLGAVLGKGKLKGFIVTGSGERKIPEPIEYIQVFNELLTQIKSESQDTLQPGFKEFSSLNNLYSQKKVGGLPTNNLTNHMEELTIFNERILLKELPIKKLASFTNVYPDLLITKLKTGHFLPLTFDSIAALGALCGISKLPELLSLVDICHQLGMDPRGTGVGLAFIAEKEHLSLNRTGAAEKLIRGLIAGKENWAKDWSMGLSELARMYGDSGSMFAIGDSPLAPIHNGYGTILSQYISPSNNLFDSDGHLFDLSLRGERFDDFSLVDSLIEREIETTLLNSLIIDYEARGLYSDHVALKSVLHPLGINITTNDMKILGHTVYKLRHSLGTNNKKIKIIPERVFQHPSSSGILNKDRMDRMIKYYHERSEEN